MNAEKRQQAIRRMKELSGILKEASRAYYAEDREIMSNLEYDALYDELVKLEEETQMVLAGSATTTVGYEAVDELPKEAHESPMLSLDKTKDREVLRGFIGDHKTLLSWKMDGLTVVLTYYQGKLQKAVTRGNGVVGEVITNNVRVFDNIPLKIPYQGELTLRGEAIITYSEFEKINNEIDYNNYKIIQINTFNEILEMRDTMQSPILMYTEENEDRTKFMIMKDGILYLNVLGAKEIRNVLRAKSAEKKAKENEKSRKNKKSWKKGKTLENKKEVKK